MVCQALYGTQKKSLSSKLVKAQKLLRNETTRKDALKKLSQLSKLSKKKDFENNYLGFQALSILAHEYHSPSKTFSPKVKFPKYKKKPSNKLNKESLKKAYELVKVFGDFASIQEWSPNNAEIEYCNPKLLPFLEFAHCQALRNEFKEALKLLNFSENNTKGLDKCRTLFKLGEVLFVLGKSTDSIEKIDKAKLYIEECLKYGNNYFKAKRISSSTKKTKPGSSEWKTIKEKISFLNSEIFFELLSREAGPGYSDLVKMKTYYAKKDWFLAFPLAEKIMAEYPNTVYSSEARLYWCRMLLLNQTAGDQADPLPSGEKELLKFIEEKPFGNFRGEAWLELAKFNHEYKWDGKKAAFYYKKALDWFRKVRENDDAVDLYTIPQKALAVSSPQGKLTYLNDWNQFEYRTPGTKEIINRRTAPWYINEKEKECLFMVGFFLLEEGKFQEANEHFSQVSSIDKDIALLERRNFPNALMRLKSCCKTGFIVLPVKSRQLLTSKNRFKTFYAEFKYILEDFKSAEKLYREILHDPKSKNTDIAAAYMGIGICHDMVLEKKDSPVYFQKAYSLSPTTAIGAEALFRLACHQQGNGKFKEALGNFKKYLKEYPNGIRAQNSFFNAIEIYRLTGKFNLFVKYAKKFIKKYPNTNQADFLGKKLKNKQGGIEQ